MLLSAWAGHGLRPDSLDGRNRPPLQVANLVPEQIGEWYWVAQPFRASDVALQKKIDSVYEQTLERTYRRNDGVMIMLSIAYGSNQSGDGFQVHRPEYCYSAQGFSVKAHGDVRIAGLQSRLDTRRLVARRSDRVEPISYWITVGEYVELPGLRRKLAQLRYGLQGEIPDGMIIRVSSIDARIENAFEIHEHFLRSWLGASAPDARQRFFGKQVDFPGRQSGA
jgi:EpsI family protein